MKQVITALSNPIVNEKLKEYKEINLLIKDIQYQEGIIEAIEKYEKIDFLILSEILPGGINITELIEKIKIKNKKINIILILEKENIELKNYFKNTEKIITFYNNEIEIKKIAEIIINENNKDELKNEIIELKKIIKETNNNLKNIQRNKFQKNINKRTIKLNKNKNKKYLLIKNKKIKIEKEIEKEFIEKNKIIKIGKKNKSKNGKIITVLGLGGVGKSVFTVNLTQSMKKNKKKILVIDLDIFNNSIHTLLGVEKYPTKLKEEIAKYNINYKQEKTIEKAILKIDKNIDLISGIDLIFNQSLEVNKIRLIEFIKEQRKNYDAIIIDTSSECKFDYTKAISNISDKLIFLSEANIIQIKKTINLLNMYLINWNIKKEKINIIFNKKNADSLDDEILFKIFKEYKIIGQVNYIKYYNTLINNNMKNIFIKKIIKKQYLKIQRSILKNEKIEVYYLDKLKRE